MIKDNLLNKLGIKLNNSHFSESDVVYMFSLIRKIYELDGKPGKYREMAFYCNWSLHSEIDDTKAVSTILDGLDKGTDYNFVGFSHFVEIFREYLKDNNLPLNIVTDDKSFINFREALVNIYQDTPLRIKGRVDRFLTLKNYKSKINDNPFGVHFEIRSDL